MARQNLLTRFLVNLSSLARQFLASELRRAENQNLSQRPPRLSSAHFQWLLKAHAHPPACCVLHTPARCGSRCSLVSVRDFWCAASGRQNPAHVSSCAVRGDDRARTYSVSVYHLAASPTLLRPLGEGAYCFYDLPMMAPRIFPFGATWARPSYAGQLLAVQQVPSKKTPGRWFFLMARRQVAFAPAGKTACTNRKGAEFSSAPFESLLPLVPSTSRCWAAVAAL